MADPPGAENDGPAQRSEEELTNSIKEAMTAYNEHNFRDYDLWELFTDDFKGWTLQDFRTAIQWHVCHLRIQLKTRGVFVQKFGRVMAAETLFIASKEEEEVP
ncbi:hypothetical protein LPUS_04614 [Lasallia pustulata]|uniref:Uncharacterized protein n=1 Tax=Lasallia pustulata TaxID=136370 RepID=A0A1W5CWW7_9LECA|nr:hypothetical protein LPUS_04614 [Lasallia pustulata]